MIHTLQLGQFGRRISPGSAGFPTTDPYISNVSLLLKCEGSDGSGTFIDSSPSPKTMVTTGNAQIDTADFKYGSSSALFDGVGDFIATTGTMFDNNTADLTVEAWLKANSGADRGWFSMRDSGTSGFALEVRSTGAVWLRGNINGTYSDSRIATATGAVSFGVWTHVALTRNGPNWTIWVGGSPAATLTSTGSLLYQTTARIGRSASSDENPYSGWIDELRVTKNVCRYTGPFTPPGSFPTS